MYTALFTLGEGDVAAFATAAAARLMPVEVAFSGFLGRYLASRADFYAILGTLMGFHLGLRHFSLLPLECFESLQRLGNSAALKV